MKKPIRRFSNSFRYRVELRPNEKCSLKRHYRGVMREVVGILDLWANNRKDRFVVCSAEAIVKRCHRYRKPTEHFTLRMVRRCLKELRERGIISRRVIRNKNGNAVEGFIVAPHMCMAMREHTCPDCGHEILLAVESDSVQCPHCKKEIDNAACVFVGPIGAPGKWRSDVAGETIGPMYWAGYAPGQINSGKPDSVAEPPLNHGSAVVESVCSSQCSPESSPGCSSQCSPHCSPKCSPHHSGQEIENENVKPENLCLTVGTGSVVGTALSVGTERTVLAKPNQSEAVEKSKTTSLLGGGISHDRPKPKTIAEHFGSGGVDMNTITCGLFEETEQSEHFDTVDNSTLLNLCDEIIKERGTHTYIQFDTEGDIMAKAMARFTKKYGENVPKYWYPFAKELREKHKRTFGPPKKDSGIATGSLIAGLLKHHRIVLADSDWKTAQGETCWNYIVDKLPPKIHASDLKAVLLSTSNPPPWLETLQEKMP